MVNKKIVDNIANKVMKLVYEGFQRANNMFDVLDMLSEPVNFTNASTTSHWSNNRNTRSQRYNEETMGEGVYSFIVNTGHPNGFEVHTITNKAFIIIQNERTQRIVTILAARPGQIRRYWLRRNQELPNNQKFNEIINNARHNQDAGLNNL